MKKTDLVTKTEVFVRNKMAPRLGTLMLAHDYKHADRVRNWALNIAKSENFRDLEIVEVTALLHDVGLGQMDPKDDRKNHGMLGAELATKFLKEHSSLSPDYIELITDAIKYHCLSPSILDQHLRVLNKKGKLLEIIYDADNLDALGAVGLMRAFVSKYSLPDYDSKNIKGIGWGLSSKEFRNLSGFEPRDSLAPVITIVDQINQQIRYYDNLRTNSARKLGVDLISFMKNFVLQLEHEIKLTSNISS